MQPSAYDEISRALASEDAGQIAKAGDQCRAILKKDPDNVSFLFLMGSIEFQLGHVEQASQWMRKVLAKKSDSHQLHFVYAEMLAQLNENSEAIIAYNRAIVLWPDYAKAYMGLGVVFEKTGDGANAIKAYNDALSIDPNYPEALNNLGVILNRKGDTDKAAHCFTRAMAAKPTYPLPLNNLGMIRLAQRKFEEAEDLFRRALDCEPDYPDALSNLGTILQEQGNLTDSASLYKKALSLQPGHPDALNNLGTISLLTGDFEESIAIFQRVLTLQPNHPEAINNLGNALKNTGKIPEAIVAYERAIALKSDNADYHKNLGMTLLAAGRFDTGWREYEWRWKTIQFANEYKSMPQPLWQGEAEQGSILLVQAEQGFGDTLQFCRYAPLAAQRGLRVILEVQPALVRLLGSLAGVERVVAKGQAVPDFNYCCPMLNLPTVFATRIETVPANVPYLAASDADVNYWRNRLSNSNNRGINIGLAWAGSSRISSPDLIAADRRRSIAPEALAPLMDIPGIRFFSLQKGGPPAPKQFGLIDWMDECKDFADTAALVANLDLVISVDTALVHLAGALGKPVWVLNRFDSCWRWFQTGESSPWYPTLRLFRQERPGEWNCVVSSVKSALEALRRET